MTLAEPVAPALLRCHSLDGPLARLHRAKFVGQGPSTIIFSHGLGMDQTVWDQVMSHLDMRGYRALLFDLPGAGPLLPQGFDPDDYRSIGNYADDLLALLDEIGIEECQFVGHSVSGMIGVLAAIEDPRRFRQLFLINASPRYLNDGPYHGGFEPADLDGLFQAMAANYQAWVMGFAAKVVAADTAHAAVDAFSKGLLAMRPDITARIARMIFQSDVRSLLPELSVPTILIHSRNDVAVPGAVADFLSDAIAGSRLVWIDADGHVPHLTAPTAVAGAIQRNLAD